MTEIVEPKNVVQLVARANDGVPEPNNLDAVLLEVAERNARVTNQLASVR